MTTVKERDRTFDIARGIGMISIIMGHLGIDEVNRFVYTFHVPLFLLISGYFYSNQNGVIRKYAKRLLLPYALTACMVIIFDVGHEFFNMLFAGKVSFSQLCVSGLNWIAAAVYGSGSRRDLFDLTLPKIGATWYLLALFICVLFMRMLFSSDGSIGKRTAAVLFIFVIGWISAKDTWLPHSVQSAMVGLLFVYLGYLVRIYHVAFIAVPWRVATCIFLWALALICSYSHNIMSIAKAQIPHGIIDIAGACAASYLIILLASKWKSISAFPIRFISWFGQNSLIVLCFHMFEMNVIPWYSHSNRFVSVTLLFLLEMIWCSLGILMVQKIREAVARRNCSLTYIP